MDIINILAALISIGFGVIGWLMPKYTLEVLNLKGYTDTMGMSEIRASGGALFIGMGLGAIILGTPAAYAMIGFCWLGASIGRITSIALDGATRKKIGFFAVEIAVAVIVLAINL
ncbi:DUF4345 family protein [bacterium]|nr:DUF4345 family protein [bacterium]